MALVEQHRQHLSHYADAAWARSESIDPDRLVTRALASVDLHLRGLDRQLRKRAYDKQRQGQKVPVVQCVADLDPHSIVLAVWSCLALRLMPEGGPSGIAYMIPYGRSVELVVGVKGWRLLLGRLGLQDVLAGIVAKDDDFAFTDHAGGYLCPPVHVPSPGADVALPAVWQYGYACAQWDAAHGGKWAPPLILTGAELRRRHKERISSSQTYAKSHPAQWARNQMILRLAKSGRFCVTAPIEVAGSETASDRVAALQYAAAGDDAAMDAGRILAETVQPVIDAEVAEDYSPDESLEKTLADRRKEMRDA